MNELGSQRFIALETYRKSGVGVATPMGFVIDGETLLVRTQMKTGKVKRMRANPRVRIAPSTGNGTPLGPWQEARAEELSRADAARVRSLFLKKYGLIWWWLETGSGFIKRLMSKPLPEWTVFRIRLG